MQTVSPKADPPKGEVGSAGPALSYLSDLVGNGKTGIVCARITDVSSLLRSRKGWDYRKLAILDKTMSASILLSEAKFSEWKFQAKDCIVCSVQSNGLDNQGKLSFFFAAFIGPFETAELLFDFASKQMDQKLRSGEHMKSPETVYQMSAREAKSLLELVKLWIQEGKPQHYTKWCQMHQIVATNLYYLGLVNRTASMSGFYYPTDEALEFFSGKRSFPKKKVFIRNKQGRHELVAEEGEHKSFSAYLNDHSDRESALREYADALNAYRTKAQAMPNSS